jgi:hypothetical protein
LSWLDVASLRGVAIPSVAAVATLAAIAVIASACASGRPRSTIPGVARVVIAARTAGAGSGRAPVPSPSVTTTAAAKATTCVRFRSYGRAVALTITRR